MFLVVLFHSKITLYLYFSSDDSHTFIINIIKYTINVAVEHGINHKKIGHSYMLQLCIYICKVPDRTSELN